MVIKYILSHADETIVMNTADLVVQCATVLHCGNDEADSTRRSFAYKKSLHEENVYYPG